MNPDTRPLPPGWFQQYDSQRQTWIYIQNNVVPPRVSMTHPLGPSLNSGHVQAPTLSHCIERQGTSSTTRNSDVSSFNVGYNPSSGVRFPVQSGTSQPGLSPAQKLYASSTSNAALYSPPSIDYSSNNSRPLSPATNSYPNSRTSPPTSDLHIPIPQTSSSRVGTPAPPPPPPPPQAQTPAPARQSAPTTTSSNSFGSLSHDNPTNVSNPSPAAAFYRSPPPSFQTNPRPTPPPSVVPPTPPQYNESPYTAPPTTGPYRPPPAAEHPHHRSATFSGSRTEPSHPPPSSTPYYSQIPSAPSTHAPQQSSSHRRNTSYTTPTTSYQLPPATFPSSSAYSPPPVRNISTLASPVSPPPQHTHYSPPPASYPTSHVYPGTAPIYSTASIPPPPPPPPPASYPTTSIYPTATPTYSTASISPPPPPPPAHSQGLNRLSTVGQPEGGRGSNNGQGFKINPLLGAAGRVVGTAVLNGILPGAGAALNNIISNNQSSDNSGNLVTSVLSNPDVVNSLANGIANLTTGGDTDYNSGGDYTGGDIDYGSMINAVLNGSQQQTPGIGQSLLEAYQSQQQQQQANSLALANAQLQAMRLQLQGMSNIASSATGPVHQSQQMAALAHSQALLAAQNTVNASVASAQGMYAQDAAAAAAYQADILSQAFACQSAGIF